MRVASMVYAGLEGRPAPKAQCWLRCAKPHKQGGTLRPANYIRARGRLRFYAANAGVASIERALALFDSVIEVSTEFRRLSSETVYKCLLSL
jgi:hypothetical protein